MNWVNDYSFQRLNGKRNIPDTFAYNGMVAYVESKKNTRENDVLY